MFGTAPAAVRSLGLSSRWREHDLFELGRQWSHTAFFSRQRKKSAGIGRILAAASIQAVENSLSGHINLKRFSVLALDFAELAMLAKLSQNGCKDLLCDVLK